MSNATRPDKLIAAAVTRLQAIGGGLNVYRARETPIGKTESPAAVVRLELDAPGERRNEQIEHVLVIAIDVVTRGAQADSIAEDWRALIHAAMFSAPHALGGLCLRLELGDTTWQTESADTDACIVTARYRCLYRTHYSKLDSEQSGSGT